MTELLEETYFCDIGVAERVARSITIRRLPIISLESLQRRELQIHRLKSINEIRWTYGIKNTIGKLTENQYKEIETWVQSHKPDSLGIELFSGTLKLMNFHHAWDWKVYKDTEFIIPIGRSGKEKISDDFEIERTGG